jgi:hypothetical protein
VSSSLSPSIISLGVVNKVVIGQINCTIPIPIPVARDFGRAPDNLASGLFYSTLPNLSLLARALHCIYASGAAIRYHARFFANQK